MICHNVHESCTEGIIPCFYNLTAEQFSLENCSFDCIKCFKGNLKNAHVPEFFHIRLKAYLLEHPELALEIDL